MVMVLAISYPATAFIVVNTAAKEMHQTRELTCEVRLSVVNCLAV